MTDLGLIHSAQSATSGGYLAADAALSATSLVVDSILDFNEDGGSLTLNGVTYTYTAANSATFNITLATGLTGAALTQDRVDVTPVVVEKTALVMVPNTEDALTVLVPHALMDRVPEGIREEGARETVLFDKVDDRFVITDILGKRPVIDGSFIDETTLPASPSDGLPPSTSPTPTLVGGVGFVSVRWVPISNHDTVTYSLYGSTTTGFTPGGGNLLVATTGSSYTHRPSPPDYAATYFYKLIASDVDGAAAVSAEASTQLVPATTPDIAADYVYAGEISVDQLTAGTLTADVTLASTITTRGGGTGAGLDIAQDLARYDSTGSPTAVLGDTNVFKGDVEATNLTVTGSAAFRNGTEISKGGTFTLQQGTTAPTSAPTVVVGWPNFTVANPISGGYGLVWANSEWNVAKDSADFGGSPTAWVYRTTNAALQLGGSGEPHPWGGLARIGTDWYTLGWLAVEGAGYQWFITRYNSSGVEQTQVSYTQIGSAFGSGADFANGLGVGAIGTDGTNILIAEFDDANDRYRIQVRNATTLAVSSTVNTGTNAGFTGPVVGILGGSFDFGASRYVVLTKNGNHAYPFTSAGTYQVNEAFASVVPGSMSGITYADTGDGSRFWSTRAKSIASNAYVYKHSTFFWTDTTDPKTHRATSTWRDTNATGGTHETNMGSIATFSMKKRAWASLTSAAIPSGGTDDPNAVSFYLANFSTITRTDFWRQTLPADGVNTLTVGDAITFAGTNPPATNNFPGATPGLVKTSAVDGSGNPHLQIEGDGDIFRGPDVAMLLTQIQTANSSADVDLTTTEVDITGATVTFTTTRPNAKYVATGSFYFSALLANSSIASGKLSVDGTVQGRFANFTGSNTVPDRGSLSQTWAGTLASAGSHTLKLRGVHLTTAAAVRVNTAHTTITVMVFE